MSGTANAPFWPLSSTYFSPAAITSICLVDLCQGVTQDGPPPVCTAIFASCAQGSTSFTTSLNGSQSFPCAYQSMNVTTSSGASTNITCGLIPIVANSLYQGGQIVISNPRINLIRYINTTAVDLSGSGISVWPQSAIDLTPVLNTIAPFVYGSSAGTTLQCAASQSVSVPILAATAGLALSVLLSTMS